jgi:hypothetical protein
MADILPFGEVLEAADQLTLDEKEALINVLNRRVIEERRIELARDIKEADQEFAGGKSEVVTPDDLVSEILS